jgi:MATE family multidrug resistance protein
MSTAETTAPLGARSALRAEVSSITRLALPIVLTQLGTMAMGLVDSMIVGRVGEQALASVSIGHTVSLAIAMPAFGICMAIEPLASQAAGAGDAMRARLAWREGARLSVMLSLPVMLLTWATLGLLPLLKVDPSIVPDARAYVFARLPSVLPLLLYIAAKTYQQALLRPRAAVEAAVVANVVHVAVGWAFVFGDAGLVRLGLPRLGIPALGAAGAGFATTASHIVMVAWLLGPRGRPPKGALDEARTPLPRGVDRATIGKILRIGTPIGLQLAAEVGIFSLVGLLMGSLGKRAVASHQIAINLASLSFMGALGIAQATSVRVGLAVGEQRHGGPRHAGFVGIALGICAMAGWALLFAFAPALLARAFTPETPVIEAAADLLRIAAVFQLADGTQVVSAGALRGAGDTRWPLVANLIVHWALVFPVAWLLAFRLGYGARGLWYALTLGLVVIAAALAGRFWWITKREIRAL